MKSRFFEIENEIAAHLQAIFSLQTEKQTILQTVHPIERNDAPLDFDDTDRIIRWNSGSIRLGKKTYCLVELLWTEDKHRATVAKIERQVWHAGMKGNVFVKMHTIFSLIRRAQKALERERFPYNISPIKTRLTHEIKGYKLICARRTIKGNKK